MKNFLPALRQLAALGLSAAAWLAGPPAARAQTCTGPNPAGNAAARGLYAEYYSGYYADDQSYFINNTAKLARVDTAANFPTSAGFTGLVGAGVAAAGATGNAEQFSARFRGSFYAPASTRYTFSALGRRRATVARQRGPGRAAAPGAGRRQQRGDAQRQHRAGFRVPGGGLSQLAHRLRPKHRKQHPDAELQHRRHFPARGARQAAVHVAPALGARRPGVFAVQATVLSGTAGASPVPALTKNSADAGTTAGSYSLSVRVTTTGTNIFPNIFTFSVVENASAACTGTDAGGGPASSGLYASYYPGYFNDDQSFFAATPPGLVRVDPQLNFAATGGWGNLVPPATGNNANPDAFSARYQGSLLVAAAGTYTFALTSDDASYLWLDAPARRPTPLSAEATVSNGGPHAAKTVTAAVTLAAGKHDLVVHFGEVSEDNVLVLQYSGPDTGNGLVVPAAVFCSSTTGPPLATAPAAARFAVQLSPNPAPAGGPVRLHLQQAVASAAQLTVSALRGRVVAGQALPAATALELPLPLGALRAGVYRLRLTSAAGTATQKLVIE